MPVNQVQHHEQDIASQNVRPELVVLDGAIAGSADALLPRVEQELTKMVHDPPPGCLLDARRERRRDRSSPIRVESGTGQRSPHRTSGKTA